MPSGWSVYYVMVLSGVLALGMPVTLWAIWLVSGGKSRGKSHSIPPRPHGPYAITGLRVNTRFSLASSVALVMIVMMFLIVPCIPLIRAARDETVLLRGLVLIVSVACFALVALFYTIRKGDVRWRSDFNSYAGDKD